MSSGLDPVILQKLEAFSHRRRKLIILRGFFAAIAMLLAAMMVVACVDYIFVLPDWVRWTLSGLAYLAVLITEWRACLRLLVHTPDPRQLARLIEHAEPKLREDLLSAVELGQSRSSFDSDQFRELVQADVASRLDGINIDQLLPVQLLRRTMFITGVVGTACLIVFTISGLQFATLLIRAMLPMANLARVSKVQVNIVEPSPAERVVPQGDSIPLVIEITGQRTSKAVLETFTPSGEREVVPMVATGPDRFSANIQVARADIAYRIRAGDALTRKYLLRAAPRPQVVRFHKHYRYPDYVKLPDKQVSEESGDLAGLEGTLVDLQFDTDQPVKTAELRMDQGKQNQTISLQPSSDGKLIATVPLRAAGFYRVHLVAAETGFENKFSPEYELRPEADLVPQIELSLPKGDMIVPANEVLDIKGTAQDDFGLAKVAQLIRTNNGAWKEIPIDISGGKEAAVERRWDLFEQGVKPGDLLTMKLVAIDLKGSRAESRPVQITVTSSGFESKRMTSLDDQRQLLLALKALRTTGEMLEKRAQEGMQQIEQLSENDPQRKQVLASFAGALDEFERSAGATVNQLNTTLRAATPGHTTGEFVMLGRLLGRMWGGAEQNARDAVNVAIANETLAGVRDLVREAANACGRSVQRARLAEEGAKVFVTSEAIDVVNESLQVVAHEQERIGKLAQTVGDDSSKWAQLVSRLRVVLKQTRGLSEVITATAEHATDGMGDRLRRLQKEFDKQSTILERTLDTGAASKELLDPITRFSKSVEDFTRGASDVKRDYMHPPGRAFQTMLQEAQPTWANFEKLRQEVENLSRMERIPEAQRGELQRARWEAKSSIFKAHGDVEEARPDSDAYFVADVRATTLALSGLREPALGAAKPFSDPEKTKALVALDKAFRLLESAHNLAEVHNGLTSLGTAERWELAALRARTANPRDWEWLEARLNVLSDELGRAQLNEAPVREAIQAAQKILRDAQADSAWRHVNEEMKQRLRPDASPHAVAQEVEQLAIFVKQALDLLRTPVENARTQIAQLTPKLNEMMAQLAQKAEKLRNKTAELAEKAPEKSPTDAQADAQLQLAQQQRLNSELNTLKDLLRSDANKQSMLEKEGRERARDADDALAMLKEPPPKAEEALVDAAKNGEGADQKEALETASTEQQKLANALNKLAKHYEALDQGNAEQTRLALREEEKNLGRKEELDERYTRAEQLAQMTQETPDGMLKQLVKALAKNPLMQQELSGISKNALSAASEKLADASRRENAVSEQIERLAADQAAQAAKDAQAAQMAQNNSGQPSPDSAQQPNSPNTAPSTNDAINPAEANNRTAQQMAQALPQPNNNSQANVPNPEAPIATPNGAQTQPNGTAQSQQPPPPNPQLAQAADQQAPIAQAADEVGMDVSRAGRHEQRLQNTATGKQLEQLGEEIRETGSKEIAEAQQALQNTQQAAKAQAPINAAQKELQGELSQLNQAQSGEMTTPPEQNTEQKQTPESSSAQSQQMKAQNQNSQQPTRQSSQNANPSQTAQSSQASQSSQQSSQMAQSSPASQQMQEPANSAQQASESGTPMEMAGGPQTAGPASPQEQVWMARTLDALDAALHADPSQQGRQQQQGEGQGQQSQQTQSGNQQGQSQQKQDSNSLNKAKQAMASAAQAASASMRASRSQQNQTSQQPSSAVAKGEQQAASKTGAAADGGNQGTNPLPRAQTAGRNGDWGKLPKKVAEQLTQGQRETVAGEYRNQVETYYRVIAERAKKP